MAVIETHTFRLVDASDLDGFLEADRRVQTELMLRRPSFLRRTTARGGDEWIVVVLWASEDDADTSHDRFAHDPAKVAFMAYVDSSTLITRRYHTLD